MPWQFFSATFNAFTVSNLEGGRARTLAVGGIDRHGPGCLPVVARSQ
jgi:hypothetical protein